MEPAGIACFFETNQSRLERIQTNDPKLSFVYFINNIDDEFLVMLATSLETNTYLKQLCIQGDPNCTITIDGWKALFHMVQVKRTIQILGFADCNFTVECAQLFATMVLLHDNVLKHMIFSDNNQFGFNGLSAIVDAIRTNPNGLPLSLSFSKVMEKDDCTTEMQKNLAMKVITLLQQNNTNIKQLELDRNYIGDDFVTIFAKELKYNKCLEVLNLQQNEISSVGAVALAHAMHYNRSLVELNLSKNFMGDNGAMAITTAVQYHPHLETLGIACNCLSLDGLINAMAFLKYNESVKNLYCGDNGLQQNDQIEQYNENVEIRLYTAVQAILEYNDVIQCFDLGLDQLHSNELIEANRHGTRTAPKKGWLRRHYIYMQSCYMDI